MEKDLVERLRGTSINPKTLLSTDYFNHFNGVIMILDMLPDLPELMPEVEAWSFVTYPEHFDRSGLSIAELAKEAYRHCPEAIKAGFDELIGEMRLAVEQARGELRLLTAQGTERFAALAKQSAEQLQRYVAQGSSLINGTNAASDQSDIDALLSAP